MKITKIETLQGGIYSVTFTPSRLESMFGYKTIIIQCKDKGCVNDVVGTHLYINQNGEILSSGHYVSEAIDNWRRSWKP